MTRKNGNGDTLRMIKTAIKSLPGKLTDEEQRQAGIELSQIVEDVKDEESRQTDQKATMKARLTELQARLSRISIKVRRKEEDRDVEVEVYHDYSRGYVSEVRKDTGESIINRRMTDEERQMNLIEAN